MIIIELNILSSKIRIRQAGEIILSKHLFLKKATRIVRYLYWLQY